MKEDNHIILRTYKSVWSFERKIHSFEDFKLLIPINVNDALYFVIGVALTFVLSKVIPFFTEINWVVRYFIIPFGIMKYLTKQKLDGKYPHKFFFDLIVYLLSPKKYYRFREKKAYKTKIKFSPVSTRKTLVVNKTEVALIDKKKKRVLKKGRKEASN